MYTEALRELLGGRAPRDKLSLGEVVKVLHAASPDMPEPARPDLMAALRELAEEDDPILVLGSGKDTIIITGNGLRMAASDYCGPHGAHGRRGGGVWVVLMLFCTTQWWRERE